MARRVPAAVFPLSVWNLNVPDAEAFVRANPARPASTAADAASSADVVVLTMLPSATGLLDLMQCPEGILAGLKSGPGLVDCSTIGAQGAAEAREATGRSTNLSGSCAIRARTVPWGVEILSDTYRARPLHEALPEVFSAAMAQFAPADQSTSQRPYDDAKTRRVARRHSKVGPTPARDFREVC